jgi:hypothetical protein
MDALNRTLCPALQCKLQTAYSNFISDKEAEDSIHVR